LDFLYTYKCNLNFSNRTLEFNNEIIKFMNEKEIDKYDKPFNIKKDIIQTYYDIMNNTLTLTQKSNAKELITKIIDNIVKHPYENKYKSISLENKVLRETLLNHKECVNFMKNIGFKEIDNKFMFADDINMLNYTKEIMC